MSGLRGRLRRVLGADQAPDGRFDELAVQFADLDERSRVALDRQEALLRDLTADLAERVAALERRLGALEARDR